MTTKTKAQQNKDVRPVSVSLATVKAKLTPTLAAIIQTTAKATGLLKTLYTDAMTLTKGNIPDGTKDTASYNIQVATANHCATVIFDSGATGAKNADVIKDYIFKQLKAEGYARAQKVLSEEEQDVRGRAIDAQKKAKARAITKAKAEIKKANPKMKAEDIHELAEVKVADMKAENAEAMKQGNAVARLLEGAESFNVIKFPVSVKEGKYSDGAMPRTLAAFAAFLTTFKEEAQE